MFWYKVLNYFFFGFHTLLILFNTFGWAIKKFRKWNLIALTLTAFSWFGLGIWYGWGYCVCTDWHWRVREHLGYHDMTNSYIQFLVVKLTGINVSPHLTDVVTVVVFSVSVLLSLSLNLKDYLKKRRLIKH
jgi:hypothetical protein